MKRANKNHWWLFALTAFLGNCVWPVLWLRTDTAIFWAGTILVTVARVVAARRLTCSRKWWVAAIVGSPLVVGPLLIGLLFIGAITGIVPVP